MSKLPTYRTMTALEAQRDTSGDLFVINKNKSDVTPYVQRNRLVIQMPDNQSMTVEATFIPQNLAEWTDKEALVSSTHFKKAVMLGLIEIVHPEDARKLLEQPMAKEEARRLFELRTKHVRAVTAGSPTQNTSVDSPTQNPDAFAAHEGDEIHCNPVMLNHLGNAENNKSSMDAVYHTLKTLPDETLHAADWNYIIKWCDERNWSKLSRWGKAGLDRALARTSPDAEDDGSDFEA